MRLPLLILLLTLMSLCDRLWSAQTDLFVGNWRFVPEESRLSETTPMDITYKLKFVLENGQLREELASALQSKSNGRGRVAGGILQFDDQEHRLRRPVRQSIVNTPSFGSLSTTIRSRAGSTTMTERSIRPSG
jgi:hypothetical protein